MPTALVTGATAGLGAAFVRALAARDYDLVLVARDESRLRNTAADLAGRAEVLVADLATDAGCALVQARLARGVDLLVNNAGLGNALPFQESDLATEENLLDVNVRAVMRLTHAALPAMLAAGDGAVLNVASVAGFAPGARGASYSASKAWVITFSESLHLQVADRGVRVLALCPGFIRTEFHARAGMDTSGIPDRLWLDADRVVADGLAALERGRARSIPGAAYKIIVAATRVVPAGFQRTVAGALRSRMPTKR